WSARLAPLFADFAQVRDGDSVLDVGCGTGSLVQTVADRTHRSQIVGIDPAQAFIEYCRKRFADPRIEFACGSALELPYPDGYFGQSLSLLVLMFIPQPEKAASEMRRVTRPGGTVAACTWDRTGMQLNAIFWEEAVRLDPMAEKKAGRPQHCNRQGHLAELWHAAGLTDIEETVLEIRADFNSFDDYWSPYTHGAGPQGAYIGGLSRERRDRLRESLRQRLLGGEPPGPFSLGAKALAVRGIVPLG
ncbi:MAG: methyltransferase domain-containing protein, partial [Burkholderiales bacterium]|nr:methyltransferase domain-containing protein [Burkholderiales bacterium]